MDDDTVRNALDLRHRLRQMEIMQRVRFGPADPKSPPPVIDSELLLAAGMVDAAEWQRMLVEAVVLLLTIRDRHLHALPD